jgi:hypothetical protein
LFHIHFLAGIPRRLKVRLRQFLPAFRQHHLRGFLKFGFDLQTNGFCECSRGGMIESRRRPLALKSLAIPIRL